MGWVAKLEQGELRPERELADLMAAARAEGAVVSFVGLARPDAVSGGELARLFLDHHPRMTLQSLEAIAADALERFDVSRTHVVHRCGAVEPRQAIVFAAACARHRRAAFEAADYLMDRLKTEAVFWKREDGADGSRWIEPTEADLADRARWTGWRS